MVAIDQQTKMNSNNKTVLTSRRLGLSRISPRNQLTPQMKRSHESNDTEETTSTGTSEAAKNVDSMITPIKKKKISFGRFAFTPKEQKNDLNQELQDIKENNGETVDELKAEIQKMKERLQKYEKYDNEKKDLEQVIEMWRAGGDRALRQLQAEIQPEQEIEKILEHLKLPADIFGSITE